MEPWGTSVLTGYSCKDFPFRTTQSYLSLRSDRKTSPKIVDCRFVKNTSMAYPAESLGYVKYYSSSSWSSIENPSNSIRYNCQKIMSWMRRSETDLEMEN